MAFFSLLFYFNVNTVPIIAVPDQHTRLRTEQNSTDEYEHQWSETHVRYVTGILGFYWKRAILHPFSLKLKMHKNNNHLYFFFHSHTHQDQRLISIRMSYITRSWSPPPTASIKQQPRVLVGVMLCSQSTVFQTPPPICERPIIA